MKCALGRLLCAAVFVVSGTGLLAWQNQHERTTIAEDLSIERIARDIWLHTSTTEMPGYGRVPANGLIVVSAGEAALIDTPWTNPQSEQLVDWLHRSFDVRVTKVVVTHSHQDCMGGLEVLHKAGAASFGLDKTTATARKAGLPVPQHTFTGVLETEVGARKLEIRYVGGGHTVDNIVVWIPDEKILFGGCFVKAVSAKDLGNTREADLGAWPGSIERLLARYGDARLIVPGHGAPGGKELLIHTLELLRASGHTPRPGSTPRVQDRRPEPR